MADEKLPVILLTNLETNKFSDIYHLFSAYLKPISDHIPKPTDSKKSFNRKTQLQPPSSTSSILALTKTYSPFLSQSLSLLSKRLLESPKSPDTERFVSEIFDTYRLCLDCIDCVSPGKPYGFSAYRVTFIDCLLYWGRYNEAKGEGYRVLKNLGEMNLKGVRSLGDKSLPALAGEGEDIDGQYANLVVDISVIILLCISPGKEKDVRECKRLLDEIRPWLRVLEPNARRGFERKVMSYLAKTTKGLAKDIEHYGKLFPKFCSFTFDEYKKHLKDQPQKGSMDRLSTDFLELVSYCAYKCRAANVDICDAVATIMVKVDLAPFAPITRLYAAGVCLSRDSPLMNIYSSGDQQSLEHYSAGTALLSPFNDLKKLNALLLSVETCFFSSIKKNISSWTCQCAISSTRPCPHVKSESNCTKDCVKEAGTTYLSFHLDALKFWCRPLVVDFLKSEIKQIVSQNFSSHAEDILKSAQSSFLQLCNVFFYCHSCTADTLQDSFKDIDKIVLSACVAAYTLALKFNSNKKRSLEVMKRLLSDGCLQHEGVKFLVSSLYGIALSFHINQRLNETLEALKLSYESAWVCGLHLCNTFSVEKKGDASFSERIIIDIVDKAIAASSLLLDILLLDGSHNLGATIKFSLIKWSAMRELFGWLPVPVSLVKRWVKMQCQLCKKSDIDEDAPTLYSYMSDSEQKDGSCPCRPSKETISIVMEQELLAYQELNALCPKFSQRMQVKIIDILLQDVYVMRDDCYQMALILIHKGMLYRASGTEGVSNSIKCLSDAIDTITSTAGGKHLESSAASHLLAVAYCLRALCTQEAEPNSKLMFADLQEAINIWMREDVFCSTSDAPGVRSYEYTMKLLCHTVDLLSVKGSMSFHLDICRLLLRMFDLKGYPIEKCLKMLWEYRRLSHAICGSPIHDVLLAKLCEYYGDQLNSLEFWITCMKDSQSQLLSFKQTFLSLSSQFPELLNCDGSILLTHVTVEEVIESASYLISDGRSFCVFMAGCLYYELADRLLSCGKLVQGIYYAREALQLRTNLLQEYFSHPFECQREKCNEHGDVFEKKPYCANYFRLSHRVAIDIWPPNTIRDADSCSLTPWKVLQCYLESTLQVGNIYEVIGNGAEAEALFHRGKSISSLQGLSLFTTAFSMGLGKVYRKMHKEELADKELQSTKQVLVDCSVISCLRCRLLMESMVNEQHGNLYQSDHGGCGVNPFPTTLHAEKLYKSSVDILNSSEWKNCSNIPVTEERKQDAVRNSTTTIDETENGKPVARKDDKKGRKVKKESENMPSNHHSTSERHTRVTRSRHQSLQDRRVDTGHMVGSKTQNAGCIHASSMRQVINVCHQNNCFKCSSLKPQKTASVMCLIHIKWELARRRQLLWLLLNFGKCKGRQKEVHASHEAYIQCISMLGCRNPFCDCCHSSSCSHNLEVINTEICGDMLAVERASLLYHLCLLSVKGFQLKDSRNPCCYLGCLKISQVVPLLTLSFVLCREVPAMVQKVSRLLAVIYVTSPCKVNLSSAAGENKLSMNQYAAYFHQASIGAFHNDWALFCVDVKDSQETGTRRTRVVLDSVQKIQPFIANFFKQLPRVTVVCISVLGGSYAKLLKELHPHSSSSSSWMIVSHLNANCQPVVILRPIDSVLHDKVSTTCSSRGSSVLDEVAPVFKSILKENHESSAVSDSEDSEKYRSLWWSRRKNLDELLCKLLREIEERWFGPWKNLVLGKWSDNSVLESVVKHLAHDLKVKCHLDIEEDPLIVVLGTVNFATQEKGSIPRSFFEKCCYIGGSGSADNISNLAFELMHDAVNKLEEEHCTSREPVVLVLDSEVQMLPWESMPVLRGQEVYRMPSVCCLIASMVKNVEPQPEVSINKNSTFPLIDPLDAFYLLNPSGDLSSTQAEFEEWFRSQNLEGKVGSPPNTEEISAALKSHDVFLYFGHGSGCQYITMNEIQKLDECAAAVLMGCRSGSVDVKGTYAPRGVAYSYLQAGSPVVVANLWDVTDKDIDRFGKAMLDAWLNERLNSSMTCVQCSILAEELDALSLNKKKRTRAAKKDRNKKQEEEMDSRVNRSCSHKMKVGYFVSEARNVCKLPYLTGAAPVCYGVPTGIWKKKDV